MRLKLRVRGGRLVAAGGEKQRPQYAAAWVPFGAIEKETLGRFGFQDRPVGSIRHVDDALRGERRARQWDRMLFSDHRTMTCAALSMASMIADRDSCPPIRSKSHQTWTPAASIS